MVQGEKTQTFLVFIRDDDSAESRLAMAQFVESIAASRKWQCGEPRHVLEGGEGDDANDSVGCEIHVLAADPPDALPIELDRQAFDDVCHFIAEACRFSLQSEMTLECYVGNEWIGEINEGVPDRGVRDGLLGEWKRHMDAGRPPPP